MPTPSVFAKGQAVSLVLRGGGATSHEDAKVLKITPKGVWLDNGPGNSPTGPFDATSGRYLGPRVSGFSQSIEAAAPEADVAPVAKRAKPKR